MKQGHLTIEKKLFNPNQFKQVTAIQIFNLVRFFYDHPLCDSLLCFGNVIHAPQVICFILKKK